VAVSRAGGQVSLRTYDGGALRDGEVDAVIMGLSGGPELGDLLAPADEDTTAGAAR
jgi:hypothetical protein